MEYKKKLKHAENSIQDILDNRKEIRIKTILDMQALNVAARLVEQANENGASMYREAGVLSYQAANEGAFLFQDERTRQALKAGLHEIKKEIASLEEGKEEK